MLFNAMIQEFKRSKQPKTLPRRNAGTLLFFPEHAQESVKKLDRHSSGTLILDRNE